MKTMEWDERVWTALKYAVTGMPVFVRKRALRKIVEASEENARMRSSNIVRAPDLVEAAKEEVPRSVQGACFSALREYGIQIE
ncbi:MAG: hypothetical protein E3J35_02600 [Methanomassiliicoccales archaeon]|nr:MAG: hypothetical protein E3J35_02600 [Methanomassiliicoccales archaeon]